MKQVAGVLVALAVVLSGCGASADDPAPGPNEMDNVFVAGFGQDGGSLVVIVVDPDQLPVARANVSLDQVAEARVRADEGGRAEFRGLTAGTYAVFAAAEGFLDARQSVRVEPGSETRSIIVMTPVATPDRFATLSIFEGMMSCTFVLWITYYMDPADCFGLTARARNFHTFEPRPDVESIVSEAQWQAASGASARYMKLALWQDHTENVINAQYKYAEVWGDSPIQARGDAPFDGIEEGNDKPFVTFFSPPINADRPVDAGVLLEQSFTIYVSEFYGQTAPELYTAVPDA